MESTFVVKRCTKCGHMFRTGVNGMYGSEMQALCDKCAKVVRSSQGNAIEPGDPFYDAIKARQDQKKGRTK